SSIALVFEAVDGVRVERRFLVRQQSNVRLTPGGGVSHPSTRAKPGGNPASAHSSGVSNSPTTSSQRSLHMPPSSASDMRYWMASIAERNVRQQKGPFSKPFMRADEGIRTLDLLHGKQTL